MKKNNEIQQLCISKIKNEFELKKSNGRRIVEGETKRRKQL